MRRRRWLIAAAVLLILIAALAALVWVKNRPKGWPGNWDAEAALRAQPADARATGRTGVLVFALIQPTRYEPAFWENFFQKLVDNVIPWPANRLAARDTGVLLVDPGRPDAVAKFSPRRLESFDGRDRDWDGTPFVDKWRRGEVRWVAPSTSTAGDVGTFLYEGRKSGVATPAQRTMLKARTIYHARLPGGVLPQEAGVTRIHETAFALLRRNPAVVAAATYDGFYPARARAAVDAVLDRGVDALVIASSLPINSTFEELGGGYPQLKTYVDAWAKARRRPAPKLLIAPQLADAPSFAGIWARHLAAVAPPPAGSRDRATLIISLTGIPVGQRDVWNETQPAVTARLAPALAAALRAKGWRDIRTVIAQEAFADPIEDPKDKVLSTNEAYRAAAARGDALAIAVPYEMLVENTDTLFLQQSLVLDGIPGYRRFMGPPADIDWARPYVRRFRMGRTAIVYAGAPGRDAQDRFGAALASVIARRLPRAR